MDYAEFIARKSQIGHADGFEPLWLPDFLFDFQRSLVEWAIRRGRAAIFADCGLGKTAMQLVWAENVARHANGRVLVLTPLSVAAQTVREAEKFGVDAAQSRDGYLPPARIVVTNYERLARFSPADFAGVVCDESSILKNFDGSTKAAVTEFARTLPYRLLCTATAAPNDYVELGTSAECLGEMGYSDMITRWFKQVTQRGHLGWGRTKYQMRPHGERDFWRWVCSWGRACRKPSDLGFEDGPFVLPPLSVAEHVVEAREKRAGYLFDLPAMTMQEEREERRRTIAERCGKVAELVDHDRPAIAWCHLNDESDTLRRMIPNCVEISGRDDDDTKESKLADFIGGRARVLISKPVVLGFGLNLQHCAHQTFFPSHSFEQWYQAIRRSYRFGQANPVRIDVVTTEGERGVAGNLASKAERADAMFAHLVELMNDHLSVRRRGGFSGRAEIPSWLSNTLEAIA